MMPDRLQTGLGEVRIPGVELPGHAEFFYAIGQLVASDGRRPLELGGTGPPGGIGGKPESAVGDGAVPDPQRPFSSP